MDTNKKKSSIRIKIYFYVGLTVFLAAILVALMANYINARKIDQYFKGLTLDTARNFASMVDAEYLLQLGDVAASDEFQALRERAEQEDREELIEEYLRERDLWEPYVKIRERMSLYLKNMKDVKYLYIVRCGDRNAKYDMYLIDDEENPLYMTGYIELREAELAGRDFAKEVEPTISNGDWGWLCSGFAPVYTADGKLAAQIGCDVGMEEIMAERQANFLNIMLASLVITVLILGGVIVLIRNSIINPLNLITKEMKHFSPSEDLGYETSRVIDLDIKSNDEIEDIYQEIRSMQIRILDYLKDITIIRKEKEKAENDVREKSRKIGQISAEVYRDTLTSVGSKIAYKKKEEELDLEIGREDCAFAIVMIDVNFLKMINDEYGHAAGDDYLKGCCHIISSNYKHSPVFRVGGDEFVAILRGEDYENRDAKLESMRRTFEEQYQRKDVDPWRRYCAASGMAVYRPGDRSVEQVFDRADKQMYDNKVSFKKALGMDPNMRS
ncbi:MAG: GGDEF domain-containing protein [Lachnospiraceae bacterium]|nr:GGDEF domain-containing protein [Lachnospiraceae bacterium]